MGLVSLARSRRGPWPGARGRDAASASLQTERRDGQRRRSAVGDPAGRRVEQQFRSLTIQQRDVAEHVDRVC